MTDVTAIVLEPTTEQHLPRLAGAFLAGYRDTNTRAFYRQQLHHWFASYAAHQIAPHTDERG